VKEKSSITWDDLKKPQSGALRAVREAWRRLSSDSRRVPVSLGTVEEIERVEKRGPIIQDVL